MTDAKRQPSFRRGLAIIVVGYLLAWNLGYLYWGRDELMQSPHEFFADYARDAHWMFIPIGASPHDGDPFFAQLTALVVAIVLTLVVAAYLSWKRMGENG